MSCYKNYQSQFILYQVCYFNKFLTLDLDICFYYQLDKCFSRCVI